MIIPAILVKTKKEFAKKIKQVRNHVNLVQIDIMDGKFVSNRTLAISDVPRSSLRYEMHLMVKEPLKYVDECKGAKMVIFHLEACKNNKDVQKLISAVKKKRIKVGIAINPRTPAEKVKLFLKQIDMVLIMTIYPGASGKKFMPGMLKKVRKIRRWDKYIDIEVDGGVNLYNINKCVDAGANRLVAGSAIFRKQNIPKAIRDLEAKIENY